MKYIKLLLCSFLLLLCYSLTSVVQAAVVGKTKEAASQVVAYYNTAEGDSELQLTNTNFASPVWVHVQILDPFCNELDFHILLTEGDTELIDINSATGFSSTQGIVVVNAVPGDNEFEPISFPYLIASMWITEGSEAYYVNAMGRELAGGVFETLQPTDVYSPFSPAGYDDDQDIILAAWADNYDFGYIAVSGSASTNPGNGDPVGLFIVDDMEDRDSCGNLAVECLFVGSPNSAYDTDLDEDGTVVPGDGISNTVCAFNADTTGFVEFLNLTIDENLIALTSGEDESGGRDAGMDYSIAIGPQEVAPPPTEDCDSGADEDGDGLIDCADPDCAADVACAEGGAGACNNDVDDDADGLTDCADDDCDGVAGCEFGEELSCADGLDNDADGDLDCADDDCAADDACDQGGQGGGGGGGCSVAGSSIGLANALLLLIPAIGIAIRRRLIG